MLKKYEITPNEDIILNTDYSTDNHRSSYYEAVVAEDFHFRLQELFFATKKKQNALSEYIEQSKSSINNYLSGDSIPKKEIIDKIAEFFAVAPDYFYSDNSTHASNAVFRENGFGTHFSYDVPILSNGARPYGSKSFFVKENYVGYLALPPSVVLNFRDTKHFCYAIVPDNGTIADANIHRGSVVLFHEKYVPVDGEIMVVFFRELQEMLVRRVKIEEYDKVTFFCDQSSKTFSLSSEPAEFQVIGRVFSVSNYTYF